MICCINFEKLWLLKLKIRTTLYFCGLIYILSQILFTDIQLIAFYGKQYKSYVQGHRPGWNV